ncbi:aspartate-semialdehyde dehydrogenase [Opitutia bacterium ISCC 51]|nr:aspartate-semialdehyde dehydrogenase [Opitutae bacterium ISCC 51]QXD29392.1 aspartate-semialdehyde dehydrogenase [Opitutae bacterium ISCC 52]
MNDGYSVGIVGATGAVGKELIRLLYERNFPIGNLRLLASARSKGKTITYEDHSFEVEEATPESFDDLDIALFSAGSGITKALAREAARRGCVVVDNSSAFRMDEEVPLIIPEINPDAAKAHKGIIANPNCSTIVALMALYPMHKAFGLKRFFASTYQAVSGTGADAIVELDNQVKALVNDQPVEKEVYPHQIAFNVLPHVDVFLEDGYTKEEMKMLNEGRKIMDLPDLKVSCTCVRVPVYRAHSVSIQAEFERPVEVAAAKEAVSNFPGSELCDDVDHLQYPMPIDYSEKVNCGVGRIRKDSALENGLSLWVSGDQLWKGAALNAIQIAELLHERGWVGITAQ